MTRKKEPHGPAAAEAARPGSAGAAAAPFSPPPAAGQPAPAPGALPPADRDAELQRQADEWKEKYLRALADLDNYRKRVAREQPEIRVLERSHTINAFLPVFDHFQMASAHLPPEAAANGLKQGLDLILAEFRKALAALDVSDIPSTGLPFDPEAHQAISQEPSETVPAGHVLRQWQSGYRLGERLIRPASVVVSSGPPSAPAPKPEAEP